jgi:hypothetical protein
VPPCVMAGQGQSPTTLLSAARKSWVAGPSPAMTRMGQAFRGLVLYQPSYRLTRTRAEIPRLFKQMVPAARVSDYAGWYYTSRSDV